MSCDFSVMPKFTAASILVYFPFNAVWRGRKKEEHCVLSRFVAVNRKSFITGEGKHTKQTVDGGRFSLLFIPFFDVLYFPAR
jgi:hypothetical protein